MNRRGFFIGALACAGGASIARAAAPAVPAGWQRFRCGDWPNPKRAAYFQGVWVAQFDGVNNWRVVGVDVGVDGR
jgi:hypothetical protein